MARKEKILKKAQKFIQKGAFEKAVAEYMSLKDMYPSDVSLRLHLGDLFMQMGRNEEAVKEYVSAAKISARLGFYLKAIAVYKRALKADSNNTDIHYKLAELYTKQRLIADAMSQYTIILNIFEQKGMVNETLELLKKIVELDPSNVTMTLRLAVLYRKMDFIDDAFEIYEDIYAVLKETGNFKKAEDVYLDLFEAFPEDPRVLKRLVDIYRGKGEDTESLKYSHALLRHYISLGELEDASSVSRDILSIRPYDEESLSFFESYDAEEVSGAISTSGPFDGRVNTSEKADADDGTPPEIEPAAPAEEGDFEEDAFSPESGQAQSFVEDASEEELEILIEGFDEALPEAGEGPGEEEGDGGDKAEDEYVNLDTSSLSDEWNEGLERYVAHATEVSDDDEETEEESFGEADVEFVLEGFGDESDLSPESGDVHADDDEDAESTDISFDTTAFEDEEKIIEDAESHNEDIVDNEYVEESDNTSDSADELPEEIESSFDAGEKEAAEGRADVSGAFEAQDVAYEYGSEELDTSEDVVKEDEPPLEDNASEEEETCIEAGPFFEMEEAGEEGPAGEEDRAEFYEILEESSGAGFPSVDEEFSDEEVAEIEEPDLDEEASDEDVLEEAPDEEAGDLEAEDGLAAESPSDELKEGYDGGTFTESASEELVNAEELLDEEPSVDINQSEDEGGVADEEPSDEDKIIEEDLAEEVSEDLEIENVAESFMVEALPESDLADDDGPEAELDFKEDGFGDEMAEPEASGDGLDDGTEALEGAIEEKISEEEESYLETESIDDMEPSLDMEGFEDGGPAEEIATDESPEVPEESFDEEVAEIEEPDLDEEASDEDVLEEAPDEEAGDLEAEDGLAAESPSDELKEGYDGGTFTESASEELVNAEELLDEEPSVDINQSEDEGGVADEDEGSEEEGRTEFSENPEASSGAYFSSVDEESFDEKSGGIEEPALEEDAPDEEVSDELVTTEGATEEDGQSFEAEVFIKEGLGEEAVSADEDEAAEADTEEESGTMAEETLDELEPAEEVGSAEEVPLDEELIESETFVEIEETGGEPPLEEDIFENEPREDFETVEDEAFTEEIEEAEGQTIDEEAGIETEEDIFDDGPDAFEDTMGEGLSGAAVESGEPPEDEVAEEGASLGEEIFDESDGGDAASDEEGLSLEGADSEETETALAEELTEEQVEADTPRESDYSDEADGEPDYTSIADGFDEEGASHDESGEGLGEGGEETETPADGEVFYEGRAIEENISDELDTPEEFSQEGEPLPDEVVVEIDEPEEEKEEAETPPGEESAEDTEPSLDVEFEEDEGPAVTTETIESLDASAESDEAEFSSVDEESSDEEIEEIDEPALEDEAPENQEPTEEIIEADNLGGADNEFAIDDFEEEALSSAESGEGLEDEAPVESDGDEDAEFLKESEAEEFEIIDESGPLEEIEAGEEAPSLEEDVFHEEIGEEEIPVEESSPAEENSFDEESPEEFDAPDDIEPSEESAEEGGGEEGDIEEGSIKGVFGQESFEESDTHEQEEHPHGLEMDEALAASDEEIPEVSEPSDGLSGEEPSLDIGQAEEDSLPAEEEPFIEEGPSVEEELSLEDNETFEDEALEEKFTSVMEDDTNSANSMELETEDDDEGDEEPRLSDEPVEEEPFTVEEPPAEEDEADEPDITREGPQDEQTPLQERPVDEAPSSMDTIYTEPELEEAIQNLARTSSAGDVYETYEELKSGLENQLSSEDAETHFNLGREYLEMELFKEASREFKIALKDSSLDIDCYINLAKCSMADANHEEAIIYLLKVLKGFNGEEFERRGFLYDLASSYASSGQESEANGIFRSIYAIDPRFRDVAKKIKALRKKRRSIPMDDSMLEVELL